MVLFWLQAVEEAAGIGMEAIAALVSAWAEVALEEAAVQCGLMVVVASSVAAAL